MLFRSITLISLSGINTQAGVEQYHNILQVGIYYGSCDDLYICDGAGTDTNDFLGICRVIGLFPNSDTGTIQWTPSTGTTHYNLVDENPPDGDTSYVETSTQAQTDLYGYPSLIGTGTILGLQVSTTVSLSAGSSIILESPIISNNITDLGPDYLITNATYYDKTHISTTDPNTGAAWTAANLAAAQIGVKVM